MAHLTLCRAHSRKVERPRSHTVSMSSSRARRPSKASRSLFSRFGAKLPSIRTSGTKACGAKTNTTAAQTSLEVEDNDCKPHNISVFPLISDKLCIAFHPSEEYTLNEIKRRPDLYFFSTDLHERYVPFCKDFGPVSNATMCRFVRYTRNKANHPCLRGRPLVYYTDMDERNQANAAVLLGAYIMLEHKMSAVDAARAFEHTPYFPFAAFRDASGMPSDFGITLENCLRGLEKAMSVGWFCLETFDVQQFEELEDSENGDVSQIGDKFVAFRGPKVVADDKDHWVCPPTFYTSLFKELGVTAVVRLNEAECYDKADFEKDGITVHDLEFADCTCPSPALVKKFLDVVEGSEGRVAVHCKAGLGRTGTMIGLWMMKNKGFSAREAIAWMRLCRPGCVIGQQQHFLAACEKVTFNGKVLLPVSTSVFRRSSSSASGADTPPSFAKTSIRKSYGICMILGKSSQAPWQAAELGRQIEQASRARARAVLQ